MNRTSIALALALLACLTACSPKQPSTPSQSGQPTKIQLGSIQISQPTDYNSFIKIRNTELVNAVRNKQITPNQARTFLKAQKLRLGMENPNQTRGLDKILKDQGLDR